MKQRGKPIHEPYIKEQIGQRIIWIRSRGEGKGRREGGGKDWRGVCLRVNDILF
jgi:hypothetical protein